MIAIFLKKIKGKSLSAGRRGFTLIELLVSVTIFSIVMTMALGALLSLSVAARRAEALKSAIDNLSFGVDSMSRAIRTGSNYHCGSGGVATTPQDCAVSSGAGANYITFLGPGSIGQVYYQLDTSACPGQTAPNMGCIERKVGAAGTWYPITSPDIIISNTGYMFHVIGAPPGDGLQPEVIITLSGTVQISPTQTSNFHLQSTVTQRIYDQ